jgi:luciferase-like monooxygenase
MNPLKKIEEEVSSWPGVTTHAHRFAGREFRFGRAEIGHVHVGGTVDIPFPRPVHDMLLADGLAQQHRWVPDSGWVTFVARAEEDCARALWLLRISYLRYALKEAANPQSFLERETRSLGLGSELKAVLKRFIPQESPSSENVKLARV